jgi:hypothetical protein
MDLDNIELTVYLYAKYSSIEKIIVMINNKEKSYELNDNRIQFKTFLVYYIILYMF